MLNDETRNSKSISEFKRKLIIMIRSEKNLIYGIKDVLGARHLSKLRLSFSVLNEYRFRHNFNCLNPICLCGMANEDSKHFLLHCPRYEEARRDLLGHLSNVPGLVLGELNTQSLCHFILYESPCLTLIANRMIMEATIIFIKATKRFEM